MTCTGNCYQGRRCTCVHMRDSSDKLGYRNIESNDNWLALIFLWLLVVLVAAGWL